jgi:hypothetical protein
MILSLEIDSNVTFSRQPQNEKQHLPMTSTDLGMEIEGIAEHDQKPYSYITLSSELTSNTTSRRLLQQQKQDGPILSTDFGIRILVSDDRVKAAVSISFSCEFDSNTTSWRDPHEEKHDFARISIFASTKRDSESLKFRTMAFLLKS